MVHVCERHLTEGECDGLWTHGTCEQAGYGFERSDAGLVASEAEYDSDSDASM